MKRLWGLLKPGLHVKRWLLLLLVGIVLLGLSIAYLQVQLYRTYPVPDVYGYLTLQFLPRPIRALLFGLLGLAAMGIATFKLSERLFRPLVSDQDVLTGTAPKPVFPVKTQQGVVSAVPLDLIFKGASPHILKGRPGKQGERQVQILIRPTPVDHLRGRTAEIDIHRP